MRTRVKAGSTGGRSRHRRGQANGRWLLRLFIAGRSEKSVTALKNLKAICETQLDGRYRIEVIDLLKTPLLARHYQILALPALVRKLPLPVRSIIGDLSNTARVLVGLDLIDNGAR